MDQVNFPWLNGQIGKAESVHSMAAIFSTLKTYAQRQDPMQSDWVVTAQDSEYGSIYCTNA